jgi:hypothetical protein
MSENPKRSEGSFYVRRYGVKIDESVEFPSSTPESEHFNDVFSFLVSLGEENPCEECPTIVEAIRRLATQTQLSPDQMGTVKIHCAPDPDQPEFYSVSGELGNSIIINLNNIRCTLLPYLPMILDRIAKNKRARSPDE